MHSRAFRQAKACAKTLKHTDQSHHRRNFSRLKFRIDKKPNSARAHGMSFSIHHQLAMEDSDAHMELSPKPSPEDSKATRPPLHQT